MAICRNRIGSLWRVAYRVGMNNFQLAGLSHVGLMSPKFPLLTGLPFRFYRWKIWQEQQTKKWTIDELNGSNWTTRKFQMKHLLLPKVCRLQCHKLTQMEMQTLKNRRFQKAFSVIIIGMAASQLYLVISYKNTEDAWAALWNNFETETLANKLFLKKQYFCCGMKVGESV